MQVKTQPFKEALEIKSDGICFDVYGNGAKRLGDLAVTKGGLVWNKVAGGKPMRGNGINVRWEEFINWVQTRRAAGSGEVVKLSSPKGKPQAKTPAKNGSVQKIAAKSASAQKSAPAQKLAPKSTAPLKSASKTIAALKSASTLKTSAAAKFAPKSASPAKLASQNGSPAKMPTAKLSQGKTKGGKPAATAKKPAPAARAPMDSRGRKAN
jgi:hypothetical protein